MKYKVKSEFIAWFMLCATILSCIVIMALSSKYYSKKEPIRGPEVTIVKNAEYYGAILDQIIEDSKCWCNDKKFNEERFQKLAKQRMDTDCKVTLQRILVNDSTGNYYRWKAEVFKDNSSIEVTWR